MKIALVTDSTSVLSKKETKDNHIIVVPTPIVIGKKQYLEGVNITSAQLFALEKQESAFPRTSQPNIGTTINIFNKLRQKGYQAIIDITLSAGISGYYESLLDIAKSHPEYHLYPYDSEITVRLQGALVLAAAKMIKNNLPLKQIFKRLDQIRASIDELFVVDDLKNLNRGGRLSNAGAFIGTMLHIKPLLTFKSGKIIAFEKIRSMKRAVKKAEQIALQKINRLQRPDNLKFYIFYSNDLQQARQIKQFVQQSFPGQPIDISEFSPVIATYLGEKSIAIAWMIDINQIDLTKR